MKMITVKTTVQSSISNVWEFWTNPEHVKNWNFAVTDWYCPEATNNLIVGGEFHYAMSAKDHSFSFDFWGTYKQIEIEKKLEIILGDGRQMKVYFETTNEGTIVVEEFEPEKVNPPERQEAGWQMILDNFKQYVEDSPSKNR